MSLYKVTTVNGHLLPEVVSALQKSIRRGLVDDALYWAVDMYLTGYDEYCWKRLRIMASEDVGPAEPSLPATVDALYRTY
jgi:replication-associated recombination protein RarA